MTSAPRQLTIRRGIDIAGRVVFAICDAAGRAILYTHSYPRAMAHVADDPAPLPKPSRWQSRARWYASFNSTGVAQ